MRAALFRGFGPPDVIESEVVKDPACGAGDVVIEVAAVSVNRTLDCAVRSGTYVHKPALPHVLGVDPVGAVVQVGSAVEQRLLGARVIARPVVGRNPDGTPALLGVNRWGGYAEYVSVPVANVIGIPDGLDFVTACVAARHIPLAVTQVREHGAIGPGDTVLVMGASGGLGSAAVQVAAHLGARVIAGAGGDDRVAAARALGAQAGVNYRKEDLVAAVHAITGGEGVDLVVENIGDPDLFPQAMATLKLGGRLVTAGGHGGGLVQLDVNRLYQRQLRLIGAPGETPEAISFGLQAVADGKIRVLIDAVMPLGDAALAHARVEARESLGKIVLRPASARPQSQRA